MPKVSALQLEDRLSEEPPQPVYALVGGDRALLGQNLQLILQAAAPPEQPGSTVRRLEEVAEPSAVFDELRTIPFMGMEGRRVVVLEEAADFLKDHGNLVLEYLESPSPTGSLIICLKEWKGSKKLRKAVLAEGWLVDCSSPSWRQARSWLQSRARAMGLTVTSRVVSSLVEAHGPELTALENELEKLSAYCHPETTIGIDAVEEVGVRGRTRSIFDLGVAISRGEKAEAMNLCERLLLRGEAPPAVLAVLARQVRQLWRTYRLKAAGASQNEIRRKLGVPSFVVRRNLKVVGRLSPEWFARQLSALAEADYEYKTASVRAEEANVWLERLVARLCEISAGGRRRRQVPGRRPR